MLKYIWGPKFWELLHSITLVYPMIPTDEDKKMAKLFINSIPNILPCKACSRNFISHLNKFPLLHNLDSKDLFVKWGIDFHNIVNKSIGKKILPIHVAYDHINKLNISEIKKTARSVLIYIQYSIPENKLITNTIKKVDSFLLPIMFFLKINEKIEYHGRKTFISFIKKITN